MIIYRRSGQAALALGLRTARFCRPRESGDPVGHDVRLPGTLRASGAQADRESRVAPWILAFARMTGVLILAPMRGWPPAFSPALAGDRSWIERMSSRAPPPESGPRPPAISGNGEAGL